MVDNLICPSCGAPQDVNSDHCMYCRRPIVVRTLKSVSELSVPLLNKYAASYNEQMKGMQESTDLQISIAMCYMKLKLHSKAIPYLSKAMELNFDNADIYFYYAICLIGDKIPFVHKRNSITEIIKYLDAAISIEDKGIYYFLKAYILYDYFERKDLAFTPDYQECVALARQKGVSKIEVNELFAMLEQSIPMEMLSN